MLHNALLTCVPQVKFSLSKAKQQVPILPLIHLRVFCMEIILVKFLCNNIGLGMTGKLRETAFQWVCEMQLFLFMYFNCNCKGFSTLQNQEDIGFVSAQATCELVDRTSTWEFWQPVQFDQYWAIRYFSQNSTKTLIR